MWIRNLCMATTAFALSVFSAIDARADYVCNVSHTPGASAMGSNGFLSFKTTTAPKCGGAVVGTYSLCTTGAGSGFCAASSPLYTEVGLIAMFQAMTAAMTLQTRVDHVPATCLFGTATCGGKVTFRAD